MCIYICVFLFSLIEPREEKEEEVVVSIVVDLIMDNSEKFLAKYSIPFDNMEHSGGAGWLWHETQDFVVYLIENKYISEFAISSLPHNGSHGVCGGCQLKKIRSHIRKGLKRLTKNSE